MAELFLAWHRNANGTRRQVVLKRILPQLASDEGFLAMFLNEARIAITLRHPNIVRCYELVSTNDGPIIVMEYVRGATIRELMVALGKAQEPLPLGIAVTVIASVCDALDYAYSGHDANHTPRRIIHRDVTPTNVLLSDSGDIKLADFGIAKAMQSDIATRTATLKGKCSYMAPELILGEPMDHRADIFSVGVMLYEITTGRRVFRRDNEVATMQAILRNDVPDPARLVPGYSPALKHIVLRAMAHRSDDRFRSAGELGDALKQLATAEGWSTDVSALTPLIRRFFPERLQPNYPASAMSQSHTGSTGSGRSARSRPHGSISSDLVTPPPRPLRVSPWEVLAVLSLVVSAMFWLYMLS